MGEGTSGPASADRLAGVIVDEASLGASSAEAEHEREIAIHDLLEENAFAVPGTERGPYRLRLAVENSRLVFDVQDGEGQAVVAHHLALGPFRGVVADYQTICASHYAAIRSASPSQIEAIDMGRRGMHNDAATFLQERLADKIRMDFPTARRLFTLLVALQWES